jgi:hypothetical protein
MAAFNCSAKVEVRTSHPSESVYVAAIGFFDPFSGALSSEEMRDGGISTDDGHSSAPTKAGGASP